MRTLRLMILAALVALFASYLFWGDLLKPDPSLPNRPNYPMLSTRTRPPAGGAAAGTAPAATRPADVVARVYDLRDLIVDIPDFTDAPCFGPRQEPTAWEASRDAFHAWLLDGSDNRTRGERIDDLLAEVKRSAAPGSWRDDGGSVGGLRELQGQLIVTHTPAAHRDLVRALDRIRARRRVARFARHALLLVVPAVVFTGLADLLYLWRRRARRIARGKCGACGYDLRASPAGQCPECGRVTPLARPVHPASAGRASAVAAPPA